MMFKRLKALFKLESGSIHETVTPPVNIAEIWPIAPKPTDKGLEK